MPIVRDLITSSMEKSIESFELGGHVRTKREISHDELVHWYSGASHLEVSFTRRTDSSEFHRKLDIEINSQNKKVQALRYESTSSYYDSEPRSRTGPSKRFEGSIGNLGIIKLGRAALVLHSAARVVKENQ